MNPVLGKKIRCTAQALSLAAMIILSLGAHAPALAQSEGLTTAVLPLAVTGQETNLVKELMSKIKTVAGEKPDTMGEEFALLLAEQLSATFGVPLVERAELDKVLGELELGESGMVEAGSAPKIGSITGAKVIVTGRMFQAQSNMIVVTKTIGVETSRVFAHTVTIPRRGSVEEGATLLASKIAAALTEKADLLVAKPEEKPSTIKKVQGLIQNYDTEDFPVVSISIDEMSMNQRVLDPAAETELGFIMQGVGFRLVEAAGAATPADVQIEGEAFSEFGLRRGNLVSSKGRVEVKAIERSTGRILVVDRESVVAVDLSPEISGKKALQTAMAQISERLIPALLKEMKTKTH